MRTVIRSVLELGTGSVSVDSIDQPAMAAMIFPPIILVAGDHSLPISSEYISSIPELTPVVFPTDEWEILFRRTWGSKTMGQKRTKLSSKSLDISKMHELASRIPHGFALERLSSSEVPSLHPELLKPIRDFFGVERFIEEGIGFCVKHDDQIVSVAHTAFPFATEFEVQVTTLNSPEYRRKGLATLVSAALIEYALQNGLVPEWDAANDASVYLALKLGYSDPDPWFVYFWKQ